MGGWRWAGRCKKGCGVVKRGGVEVAGGWVMFGGMEVVGVGCLAAP